MFLPSVLNAQQFYCPLSVPDATTYIAGIQSTLQSAHPDIVRSTPHSAKRALILSAVLPAAGQVYNRQAWKIPIIYGALGGVGYVTYNNYRQMRTYKDEYLYRVNHDGEIQDQSLADTPTSNVYNLYEAYNKTFQLSVIISVAVYGLNLLDAYVFGHLFDFQIDDDLSLNVMPLSSSVYGGSFIPTASLSLRF